MRKLTRDGRLPDAGLAERRGIITGYRAVLDLAAMGQGFLADVTLGLSVHTKTAQMPFEAAVAGFEKVRERHNVSGTVECLLQIKAGDLAACKRFHTDKLGTVERVNRLTTQRVTGSPKDERGQCAQAVRRWRAVSICVQATQALGALPPNPRSIFAKMKRKVDGWRSRGRRGHERSGGHPRHSQGAC